ncbi:pyridoxine/pyridoxamine 5'-phosphate oxidase [Kitasatospora sp. McL0602]|uniref:pyridoxine/pyridoxamine 5'-phosphate oxidase n=1 Tax=Kitasatospora sp. McL0602 TaxID=3439530 RepID=UPI003F8BCED6
MTDTPSELAELRQLLRTRPPMARELPGFDTGTAPEDPAALHVSWLLEALRAGVPDAQVVTVGTVDGEGRPDARVLTLRDIEPGRGVWAFHADARSPKGRQLAARPWAALTSYWPALGRQVRLRGPVEWSDLSGAAPGDRALSPAGQLATLVGRQSLPLTGDGEYGQAWRAAEQAQRAGSTEAPGHTRYSVVAEEVEFWQGDAGRRHVRLAYRRENGGTWRRTLLWP